MCKGLFCDHCERQLAGCYNHQMFLCNDCKEMVFKYLDRKGKPKITPPPETKEEAWDGIIYD